MGQSNLQKRLAVVHKAVQQLPGAAANAAEQVLQQEQAAQRAPDGSRWKRTTQGQPFDAQNHIRYRVLLRGAQVVMESDHPAAPFTRWGTRHMEDRAKVPGKRGKAAMFQSILKSLRKWHGGAA